MSEPPAQEADARLGWLSSIQTQLTLRFLLIAIAPVVLVAWVAADVTWDAVRAMSLARLERHARARVTTLENYANERIRALSSLARAPGFLLVCQRLNAAFDANGMLDGLEYAGLLRQQGDFLRNFEESFGASDMLLLSPEGRIIYCAQQPSLVGETMESALWRDSSVAKAVDSIVRVPEPVIAPVDAPRAGRTPASYAIGPILDGPTLVGLVAIEIPQREITAIVGDRTGLGETGQTVAATIFGDRWVPVGPLLGQRDAAFRAALPPGQAITGLLEASSAGQNGTGNSVGFDGEPVLAAWTYVPSFGWSLVVQQSSDEALSLLARLRDGVLLSLVAVLATVLAIAVLTARRISLPLAEAVRSTKRIAAGDLTTTATIIGKGEPRQLLCALRDTNADLASLVGRIKIAADQIVASSGTVRDISVQQDKVVREFASSATQVAAATNEMSATSKELSATVLGLARAADFAASTATSGRSSLVELGQQMNKLDTGGRGVASRLEIIRERAGRIDTMVGAIIKVANQTNLLAVNAAIEAEKAGAAGQGFQVVAREIDRLATQTAANVMEIEEVVIAVQTAVTEGVMEIGNFTKTVGEGCETADTVANQMALIIRQAEELRAEFDQVSTAVSAQSEGVAQVNEAMSRIVLGARQTAQSVERGTVTSGTLDEASKALESEIARFRLPPTP